MDGQWVMSLKGDFNTEFTEDREKTGRGKEERNELSQRIAETQSTQRGKSRFLASLGMTLL
jgi:hypothetical protein